MNKKNNVQRSKLFYLSIYSMSKHLAIHSFHQSIVSGDNNKTKMLDSQIITSFISVNDSIDCFAGLRGVELV